MISRQRLIVVFVIAVVVADESQLEGIVVDDKKQIIEQHYSDIPPEAPASWPSSLIKAVQVGSKLGDTPTSDQQLDDSETENDENIVEEDSTHDPKLLTSCHWGTMGCNKGKWTDSSEGDVNSSFIDNNVHSGLAGSAMAKIEARVKSSSKQSVSSIDDGELSDRKDSRSGSNHQPPQGFRLAGRVVTNPMDGLSYFLDPQKEDNSSNNDLMMTIPYRYLECGPTIESTTEAFALNNMVLRHLPKHYHMTHWMNSGGGVTVENVVGVEGEEGGAKYFDIEGNSEGHPKLLVALSPIEITVSGNNEESRLFYQGDVILMEDILGKGHKLNSAPVDTSQHSKEESGSQQHGQDVYVIMITLPHTVHLPVYDWLEEASSIQNLSSTTLLAATAANGSNNIDRTLDADETDQDDMTKKLETMRTLSEFSSKHHKYRRLKIKRSSLTSERQQPCPLEYDSAYASLFIPTHHNQYNRKRINRRGGVRHNTIKDSVFDDTNPNPPWFYTHAKESILARYLPSLRRTMLISLGLTLTSSFVYCTQLLYPPLLALWGGATVILGGALVNVLVTRWSYRRYIADWLEEWRWRREVHRNGMRKDHHETVDNDKVYVNNVESFEQSGGGCSDCAID